MKQLSAMRVFAATAVLTCLSAAACAQSSQPGLFAPRDSAGGNGVFSGWPRMLLALALVAALIYLARYLLKRFGRMPQVGGAGPVEVVWRSSLAMKQQLMLVRFGRRVLLVGSSQHGMNTLCELADDSEVEEVLAAIEQSRGGDFLSKYKARKRQYESQDDAGGASSHRELPQQAPKDTARDERPDDARGVSGRQAPAVEPDEQPDAVGTSIRSLTDKLRSQMEQEKRP